MQEYRDDLRLRLAVGLGINPQDYGKIGEDLDLVIEQIAIRSLSSAQFRDWSLLFHCSTPEEAAEQIWDEFNCEVDPKTVKRNANRATQKLIEVIMEGPMAIAEWKNKWR